MAKGQHGAERQRQHGQTVAQLGLSDATALLACKDPDELLRVAHELALRAVLYDPVPRPRLAFLYQLRSDGWLRLSHLQGISAARLAPYRLVAPDSSLPVAESVREGRPVFSVLKGDAVSYSGGERRARPATYATFPLHHDSGCLGAVIFCLPAALSPEAQRPEADEFARLESIATLLGHRLYFFNQSPGERSPAASGNSGRQEAGHSKLSATPLGPRRRGPLVDSPSRLESAVGSEQNYVRSDLDPMVEMALSNAGVGSFDWDFASGRLVYDELMCRMSGIEPAMFDGRIETFFEILHPEDVSRVWRAVTASHRTGSYKADYRIILPNGANRHIRAESRVVFTPQGKPAGMIGIARDRTEEVERSERGQRRRDFVLQVTQAFTAAASTEDIVSVMTDTVMPAIPGDMLAMFLRGPEGDIRLAGTYGYSEGEVNRLLEILREVGVSGVGLRAVADGRPLFLANREQYVEAIPDERLTPSPDQKSWLVMPLAAADGLLGFCLLTYRTAQPFNTDDQILATGIGSILAQSLARTRLFDERRAQLTELQRMMLPERLPDLPGLEIAVAYRPGSEGLMVGGDWYDALVMPDGTVSVVIGDVQGHSAQAAAVMGQLRTVMRTCAAEGHRLSDLMARSNHFLNQMDTDLFATCAIVEIDVEANRVQMVRAGHPYPLLVNTEGRVIEAEGPGGMPLGCFPDDDYPVCDIQLDEGDTMLLFTDGLVENTGYGYSYAVAELTERLGALAADPRHLNGTSQSHLTETAEEIITPTVARPKLDDVAVLLVRRTGAQVRATEAPDAGLSPEAKHTAATGQNTELGRGDNGSGERGAPNGRGSAPSAPDTGWDAIAG